MFFIRYVNIINSLVSCLISIDKKEIIIDLNLFKNIISSKFHLFNDFFSKFYSF